MVRDPDSPGLHDPQEKGGVFEREVPSLPVFTLAQYMDKPRNGIFPCEKAKLIEQACLQSTFTTDESTPSDFPKIRDFPLLLLSPPSHCLGLLD